MTNNSTESNKNHNSAFNNISRTNACPYCGHAWDKSWGMWYCGTFEQTKGLFRTELCHEREKSQKLEVEVERLRAFIKKRLEILDCDFLPTMSTLLNQFLEIYPYLLYLFIRYKKYPHIPCMSNDRSEQRLKN